MFIAREIVTWDKNYFSICSFGEKTSRFSQASGDYKKLLSLVQKSSDKKKLLLLDENKFSWIVVPVVTHFDKACSLSDMKKVIDPIFEKYRRHDTESLFYYVDGLRVDGQETEYYIGKKWEVTFSLHIVSMARDVRYDTKAILGDQTNTIHFYPSSFFTLHHINKTLNKSTGTLLSLGEHHTKRIVFENGHCKGEEIIDLWWQVLKDVYTENTVEALFWANQEQIEANPYAKNLVEQSNEFYVDMLVRRLRSTNTKWDLFFVSSLAENQYFMKQFTKKYQQYSLSFVVPMMHVKWLKTYGRKRSADDLDIQTAAHYFI